MPADATITGLFATSSAVGGALLEEGKVFPLRNQVDVAMKSHDWRGGRYGTHPECSLLASPRQTACDTVQTLDSRRPRPHVADGRDVHDLAGGGRIRAKSYGLRPDMRASVQWQGQLET